MLRSYVFSNTGGESAETQFNKFLANTNISREQVVSVQYTTIATTGSAGVQGRIFILIEEKR